MISLIPHYLVGKPSSKRCQLWFPAYHKKLVKTYENHKHKQEIQPDIQGKKDTMDCCDSNETLEYTKDCLVWIILPGWFIKTNRGED